jgi:hypothetical protein
MEKRFVVLFYLLLYGLAAGVVQLYLVFVFPPWFQWATLASRCLVVTVLTLYLCQVRPAPLRELLRGVPFYIVLWDLFCLFFQAFSSAGFPVVITLLLFLLRLPSWQLCFRYGFRESIALKREEPEGFDNNPYHSFQIGAAVVFVVVILAFSAMLTLSAGLWRPRRPPCTSVESDAAAIESAIADYFAVPTRMAIRKEDVQVEGLEHEWEIDASDPDLILIRVYQDPDHPCSEDYQNAQPDWQDGVYIRKM